MRSYLMRFFFVRSVTVATMTINTGDFTVL